MKVVPLLVLIALIATGCKGQMIFQGSMPDPRWMVDVRTAKGWLTIEVPAECKQTWYDVVVTTPKRGARPTPEQERTPGLYVTIDMLPRDTIYKGRLRPGESMTKHVLVADQYYINAKRDEYEGWSASLRFSVPSHFPEKELTHTAQVSCSEWWTDWEAQEKSQRRK